MAGQEIDFFSGKRKWSRLKDQVLRSYLPPYLKKVNRLGKAIVLVDSFAGPGMFEEDNEEGSPLIICKTANEFVPGRFLALLVNNDLQYHKRKIFIASSRRKKHLQFMVPLMIC